VSTCPIARHCRGRACLPRRPAAVAGVDLARLDLGGAGDLPDGIDPIETAEAAARRYGQLKEELTREELIRPGGGATLRTAIQHPRPDGVATVRRTPERPRDLPGALRGDVPSLIVAGVDGRRFVATIVTLEGRRRTLARPGRDPQRL
jgi:hypothetical protein